MRFLIQSHWFFFMVLITQIVYISSGDDSKNNASETGSRSLGDIPRISSEAENILATTTTLAAEENIMCTDETDPDIVIKKSELDRCCKDIVETYLTDWTLTLVQLSDYLRILRRFGCPQFADECARMPYSFSVFNKLTYERFCNETKFLGLCEKNISDILSRHNSQDLLDAIEIGGELQDIIRDIHEVNFTLEELADPCIQVSFIDTHSRPRNGFFELKETEGPICGIIWCGFPGEAFTKYEVSEWNCMPQICQINAIILMVTCALFAIACTLTNVVSLFVFASNRRLRDSQGIFKMSIAIADLLIGIFGFTAAIETMRRAYMQKITLIHPNETGTGYPKLDIHSFTRQYHGFVGFFITISTTVSVYTLMVASFDRFLVVFRPLRYNLYTAKAYATKLSVVVWIIGFVFALLPIIVPSLQYQRVAGFLVSFTGESALILLTISFALPIVLVLVANIATFVFSKKNAKARPKHIPAGAKVREISVENRLAKTLFLMVGTFLLCLLPIGILIPLHLSFHGIDLRRPHEIDQSKLTLISGMELICCIVFLSNSLWNFFIYSARSEEFRKACKSLFATTKERVRSKLFRNSAKEARQRRTSAAISNSSQVPCNTATSYLKP